MVVNEPNFYQAVVIIILLDRPLFPLSRVLKGVKMLEGTFSRFLS
jgi:hypothetical protein